MMSRIYGLAGLGILCFAGIFAAQNPRADNLPPPGLATPNFSQAVPKPPNVDPKVPPGFSVSIYAEDLPGVRWMQFAPNGDLFVSQYARSTITVLRDTDKDGKPNTRTVYANGSGANRGGRRGQNALVNQPQGPATAVPCAADVVLPPGTAGIQNPMGMAFRNGFFYVANTDSIVRYRYTPGDLEPQGEVQKIVDLPSGGSHGWRNVLFNRAGTKMYVTVGSASNNRAGEDCRRAAILEFNADGTGGRIFAAGLRNPEGLAWEPMTNRLWTVVNERDLLGDDLVPDFFTSVRDGGFYGWPYSYLGQNYDPRYVGAEPELVKRAIVPDVLITAHSAPVGLAFYTGTQFPARYRNGAFIALHGSWGRSKASGYKVVFVPFTNGTPGAIEDFMTGFVLSEGGRNPDGSMAPIIQWGRPTGVTVARDGSLLVSDDQGGRIWQIKYGK
ncbi:MAG TPA: sorbosone dehydrogenase family protein [Terriglobia bacterium]|nr:sorbosone dehydrogenase family protein [Terriglobia bacterium]